MSWIDSTLRIAERLICPDALPTTDVQIADALPQPLRTLIPALVRSSLTTESQPAQVDALSPQALCLWSQAPLCVGDLVHIKLVASAVVLDLTGEVDEAKRDARSGATHAAVHLPPLSDSEVAAVRRLLGRHVRVA